MLAYRTHIYTLAMAVSAEATTLALSLGECVTAQQVASDRRAVAEEYLPDLRSNEISLRVAVDKLSEALPPEARKDILHATNLMRHLGWIKHRLAQGLPGACLGDPIDIVKLDLPEVLKRFEKWYERQSPTHSALGDRVQPHIAAGQFRTALRDAWPFFKTRMVKAFGLSDDLDGDRLVTKLFGSSGVTVGLFPNDEREGYLNLFKGLYMLSRNPVAHGDVPENPEEFSAILALINSALVRIENALSTSGLAKAGQPSAQKQDRVK